MAQLRRDFDQFVQRDTVILVVGPEGPNKFQKYWRDNDLPFVGLPNPDHSVLKRFGQEIKIFKFGRMPAQVLVDKKGMVRFVHYGKSMSDIPENEELFELIDSINRESETE
jgi:peroxiredoxin Q/BCP